MLYTKSKHILIYTAIIVLSLMPSITYSQDENLHKEVQVVRPYKPAISNAYKINELPEIKDTVFPKQSFDYNITTTEVPVSYRVKPIKPAKMVSSPIPHLYKAYLKMGMANYTNPLFEAFANSTRAEDYAWMGHAKHESSFGRVQLNNNKKVFGGYHDSRIDLHGKKLFKRSALKGDIDFNNNTVYNYGYRPTLDTSLNKNDIMQNYSSLHAHTDYESIHHDSSSINYKLNVDFNYLQDHFNNKENIIDVGGDINRFFSIYKLGLFSEYTIYDRGIDSLYNAVTHINPYVIKTGSVWQVKAGLSLYADNMSGNTTYHPYPVGHIEYHLIDHVIIPFVGVDGKLEVNSYQKLVNENPFIKPGLTAPKTNHQLRYYGGMKGSISSNIGFNIRGSYAIVDDMYFFVNDSVGELHNKFTIVTDEVEYLNLFCDLYFNESEDLDVHLITNYHGYGMATLPEPWHRPKLEIKLSANYNLRDKIIINGDLISMGKRYAKAYSTSRKKITLNGFTDINLGIEYRYTNVLSGFIKIYNLMAARYSYWNQYPTQRFKIMAGFTYAL